MNKFQLVSFWMFFLWVLPLNELYAQRTPRTAGEKKINPSDKREDSNQQKTIGLGDLRRGLKAKSGKQASQNRKFTTFEEYKKYFFRTYWDFNPEYASYLGLSKFDTYLSPPNQAQRTKALTAYHQLLEQLHQFNPEKLSNEDKTDFALIKNELESSIWYAQEFRSHEWNPSIFNIGGGFDRLVSDKDLTLAEKLRKIYLRMKSVPNYYKAAVSNIQDPTMEHSQLAAFRIGGTLKVFDQKIRDLAAKATSADWGRISESEFNEQLNYAIEGIKRFEMYLNKKVLPTLKAREKDKVRSFRIGEKSYEKKFQFDIQSGYSAKELYEIALKEKEVIHQKMFALAEGLWEKYFPTTRMPDDKLMQLEILIDEISQKHVKREEFMDAIKKQLPELVEFVNKKDLLYLDPSKPLEVRATPEYMRGTAGASISAPGPFDKDAPTFYNVTPLDHYTEDQAKSYLREYNHYMLQILNIHEAIPGHYAQLVYANQSPSLVKSIFGNGAMIEGWACYTERMMLEEGYGDNAPELWLMYYKWNLRIVCNTILDYSVHVLDMTKEEAMDLLTREAFQEQTEAEGKWSRVQLTQVQLCSYFAGLTEIYNFREEQKKLLGKDFNLKAFHEEFLSFGSAPVKEIKRLMAK